MTPRIPAHEITATLRHGGVGSLSLMLRNAIRGRYVIYAAARLRVTNSNRPVA